MSAFGYFATFVFLFMGFATAMFILCYVCFMLPEPEPESSDVEGGTSDASRRQRYRWVPLDEASDPELWQEVRHHESSSEDNMDGFSSFSAVTSSWA